MNFESRRIETFISWTKPYIDIKRLASSGLYFIGPDDNVKCEFCSITLHSFNGSDSVIDVHSKHSPKCLQRYHPNNIPIERTKHELIYLRSKFDKIIKFLSTLKHTDNDRKLLRNFINELYILKHHDVVDSSNIRNVNVNSPPLFRPMNDPNLNNQQLLNYVNDQTSNNPSH